MRPPRWLAAEPSLGGPGELTAPARLFAGDDPAESNQTTEPAGPGRVDRADRKGGTARGTAM